MPTTRDRRALLAGAISIGLLVGTTRIRPMWAAWRQRTVAFAADAIREAGELDAAVAVLPTRLDSLEARTVLLSKAGGLVLSGETAADAGGSFSAMVAEVAHQSKVRINGASIHVDTASLGLARVRIDIDGTGDINGLSAFLSRIERGPTLISVPRLVARATNAESDTLGAEQLSLQLTLEALASVKPAQDSQ